MLYSNELMAAIVKRASERMNENPMLRFGQALWLVADDMHDEHTMISNWLTASITSDYDPYHKDENIGRFLVKLEEQLS